MRVSRETFDRVVMREASRVMASLPADLQGKAARVSIVTADRPTPLQVQLTGGADDLVGIYEGIALPDRHVDDSGTLPDRITLFRVPLEASCHTMRELRGEIRVTVLHELGHFFGFEEDELEKRGLG